MAGRKAKTVKAAKAGASRKTKTQTGTSSAKAKTAKAKTAKVKTPVSRKTAAKKPVAKKPAEKKPAAKKPTAKKASVKTAAKRPQKRAVDKVVSAARKVGKAKPASLKSLDAKVLTELTDMAKYIRAAKREIAAIRPDDVKDEFLPKAADELDAVVQATADATNTIMDACELVEGVMGAVPADVSNTLMEATTNIYEACTFQDITGQRITKVVDTMKHIEERIDALMDALGAKRPKARATAPARKSKAKAQTKAGENKEITDADLLEGPQLGAKAKSQAEIDDLLASFD